MRFNIMLMWCGRFFKRKSKVRERAKFDDKFGLLSCAARVLRLPFGDRGRHPLKQGLKQRKTGARGGCGTTVWQQIPDVQVKNISHLG